MSSNIEVIDINKSFDNGYLQLKGWAIKSFAILASRFENATLIDTDVFFLQDLSELFKDPTYEELGVLFFYDRTVYGTDLRQYPGFMRATMPLIPGFRTKAAPSAGRP
ncbi:hypothetical protein BG006_007812, partial [Podila minutissima]